MHNRWLFAPAALLGLIVASQEVRAAVIVTSLPNPSAEPNLLAANSDAPSGTILAFQTLTYQDPVITAFKGTVTEAVLRDATTGDLDFLYQVHADPAANTVGSARFTTTNFAATVNIGTAATGTVIPDGPTAFGAGYTVTASPTLLAAGFVNTTPGSSPPEADRNAPGIGFQRSSGTDQPPGAFGNILFLRTNATNFDSLGLLALIDSSAIARIAAYEPFAPTPEPSTVVAALTGLSLCGVASWMRRFRKAS